MSTIGGNDCFSSSIAKATLEQQAKKLSARNDNHRSFPHVLHRVKDMDLFLMELSRLIEDEASLHSTTLFYLECLSFIDETDSILLAMSCNENKLSYLAAHCTKPLSSEITELHQNSVVVFDDFNKRPIGWNKKNVTLFEANRNTSKKFCRFCSFFCLKHEIEADKDESCGVRDVWSTQTVFFLSCLGFIVGVGNTLRFPSMIFRYGGAFFIPYLFYLAVFGLPLVYMHLCIGQYSGLSASGAFTKMMPIASGIGWALVLLAVPVAIYYNIIVAWSLYYFWYSFVSIFTDALLPWSVCQAEWVTRYNCCELDANLQCYENAQAMTSTEAFFHYQVLNRTLLNNPTMGSIQSHILVALIISWILVFFGIFKGLGSIGWAVSFTATFPYLLLFLLFLRGISLNGSSSGMRFLFTPDFHSLWSLSIWKSAAEQVFYSLGIDAGPLISMASFSRHRNNIYRDAILLVVLDTFTSVLCSMVIFSFIGFLATEQGKNITDILKHDSLYIAFTVYPGVTSFMEWGFLWASLFFAMLTLSALDAEFAWLEMIASSIMNCFGCNKTRLEKRLLFFLCVVFCACGIPLTARGGIFIFHAIENLNANWNTFSLSLMQIIIVCFIYGHDKFLVDIAEMLRIKALPMDDEQKNQSNHLTYPTIDDPVIQNFWPKPLVLWNKTKYFFGPVGPYVKWTWCLFSPLILVGLLLMSVFGYEKVSFNGYILPWYYEAIAWFAMVSPLLIVPIIFIHTIYNAYQNGKPLKSVINTENWSKKEDYDSDQQLKHTANQDDEYWYIDPLSRGPSAKSKLKVQTNHSADAGNNKEEINYSSIRNKIREIKERVSAEIASMHNADNVFIDSTQFNISNEQKDEKCERNDDNRHISELESDKSTIEVVNDIEDIPNYNEGMTNSQIFAEIMINNEPDFIEEPISEEIAPNIEKCIININNKKCEKPKYEDFPSVTIPDSTVHVIKTDDEDEEYLGHEGESDYRQAGRIRQWQLQHKSSTDETVQMGSELKTFPRLSDPVDAQQIPTNKRKGNSPINKETNGGCSFLFGPPPQLLDSSDLLFQNDLAAKNLSTITNPKVRRIKSRSDRGSDQRRNRAFNNFNFIEMVQLDKPKQNHLISVNNDNLSEDASKTAQSLVSVSDWLPSPTTNSSNSISSSLTELRSLPTNNDAKLQSTRKNEIIIAKLKRPLPIVKDKS